MYDLQRNELAKYGWQNLCRGTSGRGCRVTEALTDDEERISDQEEDMWIKSSL